VESGGKFGAPGAHAIGDGVEDQSSTDKLSLPQRGVHFSRLLPPTPSENGDAIGCFVYTSSENALAGPPLELFEKRMIERQP
jgi:hypothetical protein